jgi:hypothetical protein
MQRTIVIGEAVTMSVLGAPLDPLVERFYMDYFAGRALPWDELDVAAGTYFDQHPTDPSAHDDYFNNFISLWRHLMGRQNQLRAEFVWERALKPALAWEQAHPGQFLHKGTPYYFWAMTVILRRDMDRGYLIIHRALDEDIRTHEQQCPDTPGFALVSLNYEKPDQAFRPWVVLQAQHVEQLLHNYNTVHQRNLTMDQVKQRFLTNPPTTEALFLFTYTLARLVNISDEPIHVRANPFAGQLELNLFFDITLVIDAVIKVKDAPKWQFIDHAEYLLTTAGHALNNQELKDINSMFKNSFDDTVRAALDGTLTLPAKNLDHLQCDIALAYGLRNYGAHNTGTAATAYNRFPEVEQTLFRVLFAAIEFL